MSHKNKQGSIGKRLVRRIVWGGVLTATVATAANADMLTQKSDAVIAHALAAPAKQGAMGVVLQLEGKWSAKREAELHRLGGYLYRHLDVINAVAVKIPTRNLRKLAALPYIKRISADMAVRKTDEFTVQHTGADVAFTQNKLTGAGVGVAVLDTGIGYSADLNGADGTTSRVVGRTSFAPKFANDDCGHGTVVAGLLGGNGASSIGASYFRTFYGVARNVNLIDVRVLDSVGAGTVSNVIAGIQWCITNKTAYKLRVINLSLGHPVAESYTTDPLCKAVESAWKAGLVVVVAAGNQGRLYDKQDPTRDNEGWGTNYGSINSPANDPYVITVGAMKQTDGVQARDRIATYSGRGPSRLDYVMKPDIVAPGNQVISLAAPMALLANNYGGSNAVQMTEYYLSSTAKSGTTSLTDTATSFSYFRMCGTSMSAPVVSGAVAMILQKYPKLTPDTVKARLMTSATRWAFPDGTADACAFGAGYLNIPAALDSTVTATTPALSPSLELQLDGTYRIDPKRVLWGTRAIWGAGLTSYSNIWGRAVWGTDTLSSSLALFSSALSLVKNRAVWGTDSAVVDLSSVAIQGE